jgi:hypothetical protein
MIRFLLPLTCLACNALAQKATPAPEPPKDPNLVFQANFEDQKPGPIPPSYFVVDGVWTVAEIDGGKALKLAEAPLLDAQVQVGDSLKETGGTVSAKFKADKKRRSQPRFGIGLHGITGYRLRLFPAGNKIELVRNEEVVAAADLSWDSAKWWNLELTVDRDKADTEWEISGRAWPADAQRPSKANVTHQAPAETKFSGKASINGTPFAGLPIHVDEIEVRKSATSAPAPAAEAGKAK